jgi:hypothetical protein
MDSSTASYISGLIARLVQKYQMQGVMFTIWYAMDVLQNESPEYCTVGALDAVIEECERTGGGHALAILIEKDVREIRQLCLIDCCTVQKAVLTLAKIYNVYESVVQEVARYYMQQMSDHNIKKTLIKQVFSFYPSVSMHTFRYLYFHPTLIQEDKKHSRCLQLLSEMIESLVLIHRYDGVDFEVTEREMIEMFVTVENNRTYCRY